MRKQKILIAVCIVLMCAIAACFFLLTREQRRIREEEAYLSAVRDCETRIAQESRTAEEKRAAFFARETAIVEEHRDPAYRASLVNPSSLPVTAYGDSVMLGAVYLLRTAFPEGTIDARQNRSHYELYSLIQKAVAEETLGDPVIIAIGTNAPLSKDICEKVLDLCGSRQVFWLTTTNNQQFANTELIQSLGERENVTVLDWDTYTDDHPEYFYSDGIHLTFDGQEAYCSFIVQGVTERYYELLPKEENPHILFLGDSYLLSSISSMGTLLEANTVKAMDAFSVEEAKAEVQELREKEILPGSAVLVIADSDKAEEAELASLLETLSDCSVSLIEIQTEAESPGLDALAQRFPDLRLLSYEDEKKAHPEDYAILEEYFSPEGAQRFVSFLFRGE